MSNYEILNPAELLEEYHRLQMILAQHKATVSDAEIGCAAIISEIQRRTSSRTSAFEVGDEVLYVSDDGMIPANTRGIGKEDDGDRDNADGIPFRVQFAGTSERWCCSAQLQRA